MGALYIELSSCFFNKSKLYARISGTCAEELKRKKTYKDCQKTTSSGYPEREKTGSIILI